MAHHSHKGADRASATTRGDVTPYEAVSCEQAWRSSTLAPIAAVWLCAIPLGAQTPPRPPTVCENCWPTECGPGNWRAGGAVHTRARPANSARLAFSLQPGDTFVVDSSVVRVTQFGRAVVQERYKTTPRATPSSSPPPPARDTTASGGGATPATTVGSGVATRPKRSY